MPAPRLLKWSSSFFLEHHHGASQALSQQKKKSTGGHGRFEAKQAQINTWSRRHLCLAQGWCPNPCSEGSGGEKHLASSSPWRVGCMLSPPVSQRLCCQGADGCLVFPQSFSFCCGQEGEAKLHFHHAKEAVGCLGEEEEEACLRWLIENPKPPSVFLKLSKPLLWLI